MDKLKRLQLLVDQERRERAKESYYEYLRYTHPIWQDGKHLLFMIDKIEKFLRGELMTDDGKECKFLLISCPPQHGKFLERNTPVLTTNGWKNHGDLQKGDYVFGQDGKPKKVLANTGIYEWEVDEVVFNDKDKRMFASKQHLWNLQVEYDDKKGRRNVVIETQDIFKKKHRRSPYIDIAPSLDIPNRNLPIDPYTLGVWLGDGDSRQGNITVGHEDISHFKQLGTIKRVNKDNANPIYKVKIDGLTKKIKECGLYRNKHIPIEYLLSSTEQRLELLKGLMDTDGFVDTRGRCEFTQKTNQLAHDVYVLIRSLGFKATTNEYDAKINGKIVGKKTRVMFSPYKDDVIFKLKRKQERINNKVVRDRDDKKKLFIKEIVEHNKTVKGNCITVEDEMYLAGYDLIPTHNSLSTTESLPSYVLGKRMFGNRRYERIIALAYGDTLATKFGKKNRGKVEEFGNKIFDIELDPNSKSATDFDIMNSNSSMISRGIMAGVTGNAGDLIIVDDPFKNKEEAYSELTREKVWEEFLASVESRLSAKGKVIVIHTRWHPDDLIGRIHERKAFSSVYYNFPLEAEENDLLGREKGDALFPEIGKDKEWLQEKKALYMEKEGQSSWFALYQGRPAIQGGNIVKRDWFKLYDKLPPMGFKIISVDATFKDGKNSDFVSIQVWGKANKNMYLIDKTTERMGFVATTQAIKTMLYKHKDIRGIVIEDKANGSAIIDTLRREINVPILPVNPKGGKVSRLEAVAMHIEQGKVFLPAKKEFTHDFIEQCVKFPAVPHDDDVDSMTQALTRLINYRANVLSKEDLERQERLQERRQGLIETYGGERATRAFINY